MMELRNKKRLRMIKRSRMPKMKKKSHKLIPSPFQQTQRKLQPMKCRRKQKSSKRQLMSSMVQRRLSKKSRHLRPM